MKSISVKIKVIYNKLIFIYNKYCVYVVKNI